MSPKREDAPPFQFERKPAGEEADISSIVRSMLLIQAQKARAARLPLARGTHAKGVAVRAEFEVHDPTGGLRDPHLTARLAQGIFARPGVYPATVRFASASSSVDSDKNRDVRAVSFFVEDGDGRRHDYSFNCTPTFALNTAHDFAVLVGVASTAGVWAKLKAIWALSPGDLVGLFLTIGRGVSQQRSTPLVAYQRLRYWSNVPFRHGSQDAVKYSLIPNAANPAAADPNGPDWLQDELKRHVNEDERMSEFDFAIQLLDADRMTYRGRRRDAQFWIENASVEWKEPEAPFHTVARLRLLPKSVLSVEETSAFSIDVTEHSTPATAPLGGINRARWSPELSSRVAREGGIADLPPLRRGRPHRVFNLIRWAALAMLGLFLLTTAAGYFYEWRADSNVPPLQPVGATLAVNQGWGSALDSEDRVTYYYTPQGASLLDIRYSWFINVERPFSKVRVADPDHMRRLNFILDPTPSTANPDHLPVGFSRHYDPEAGDFLIDLTCSACHTGQLDVTLPRDAPAGRPRLTTAIRVDGGQAMMAVTDATIGSFVTELLGGLSATLINPFKFQRFSSGVLGRQASITSRARLWAQVAGITWSAGKLAVLGGAAPWRYPTQEGYGRTAAIGRIANTVFGDHLDSANYRIFKSPESYPYLWNIWKFDWEQYGAFVAQPMARNAAEALGTGARYHLIDEFSRPIPGSERFRTSFNLEGVEKIESALRRLAPPVWPANLLGEVVMDRARRGRDLFVARGCLECHGPHVAYKDFIQASAPGRVNGQEVLPLWKIRRMDPAHVATDPNVSRELATYRVDVSRMGLDLAEVKTLLRRELEEQVRRQTIAVDALMKKSPGDPARSEGAKYGEDDLSSAQFLLSSAKEKLTQLDRLDFRSVSIGEGLNVLDMLIRARYYADHNYSKSEQACTDGFGMLDIPDVGLGYKPRPLEGVWATPPFLHNGSVPTIYDLLSSAEERPRTFYVGRREYDPRKLGYVTHIPGSNDSKAPAVRGEFLVDTSLDGNSNWGHLFTNADVPGKIGPALKPDERDAILEYLKIHRDDLNVIDYYAANKQYPPPTKYNFPDCGARIAARN